MGSFARKYGLGLAFSAYAATGAAQGISVGNEPVSLVCNTRQTLAIDEKLDGQTNKMERYAINPKQKTVSDPLDFNIPAKIQDNRAVFSGHMQREKEDTLRITTVQGYIDLSNGVVQETAIVRTRSKSEPDKNLSVMQLSISGTCRPEKPTAQAAPERLDPYAQLSRDLTSFGLSQNQAIAKCSAVRGELAAISTTTNIGAVLGVLQGKEFDQSKLDDVNQRNMKCSIDAFNEIIAPDLRKIYANPAACKRFTDAFNKYFDSWTKEYNQSSLLNNVGTIRDVPGLTPWNLCK